MSAHATDTHDRFENVFGSARGSRDRTEPEAVPPAVLPVALMAAAQRYVAAISASGPADADVVGAFSFDVAGDGAHLTVIYTCFDSEEQGVGSAGKQVFINHDGTLDGERDLDVEEARR